MVELSGAEEVSHRVVVGDESELAHRTLVDLSLPISTGLRVLAIRGGNGWSTDVGGETILVPGDVLFLEGPPAGISKIRVKAGAAPWVAPEDSEESSPIDELDRAIDLLIEMKNMSETAVGLAYSALVLGDRGLAAEVRHLEGLLDDMHDRLETWVLRAASANTDPSPLRGLLHLAAASEDIGDQASQMVMIVESGDDIHPVLGVALAESDEIAMRIPIAETCVAEGQTLADLRLDVEPGFTVLAIRRGDVYRYRPSGRDVLSPGDEVIASGPDEGRERAAELFGWRLQTDPDTGEYSLIAL